MAIKELKRIPQSIEVDVGWYEMEQLNGDIEVWFDEEGMVNQFREKLEELMNTNPLSWRRK